MQIRIKLKENALFIAIAIVFILIIIGSVMALNNRQMMGKSLLVQKQVESVLSEIDLIHDNIRFMDISSRGFALIRKPEFLFWDTRSAQLQNKRIFHNLDSLFKLQEINEPEYEPLKKALINYTNMFSKMVKHLENNEMDQYLAMLEYDYGKEFYQEFEPFLTRITKIENQKSEEAQARYQSAMASNRFVQSLLFIVGLPTLLWIFTKIRRDNRERIKLLLNLEKNNKQFIFDNGMETEKDAKLILNASIKNFQQASRFVGEIASGNYEVAWEGITPAQIELNKNNLAGKLMFMRDEMKRMQEEDKKRLWVSQGLSQVSDIISKYQNSHHELTWQVLTFFVKYSGSQQGGFFVVREDNEGHPTHLELEACYAFDRKKFIERNMPIGQGLIGEVYLGGATMMLKEVPDNYITITSGLGDSTPRCIVIVPLKHNGKVEAIIELASFHEYLDYQIQFLEKAGEFIASALFTSEQNEKNKSMMEQMTQATEQLRAQEEELKQNIEELEATQEVMRRQAVER
jgi:CHASE3 domain sensor protein